MYAGVKVVSIAPDNPARGLPRIQGTYLLFHGESLAPLAICDGADLTSVRTPAVSAVAKAIGREDLLTDPRFSDPPKLMQNMPQLAEILDEVFGYTHPEIAEILGRRPAAIRQLAHRAREHVHARRPRYQADPRLRRQVTERFVAAVSGGDLPTLLHLLAPEVTLWADGGGKAPAAGPRPVHGRDRVARLLTLGVTGSRRGLGVRYRQVNGEPAALLFAGDSPFAVIVLDLTPDGEQVCGIYTVTNPDKLAHVD